jgi:hypothetical protein
MAPGGRIHHNVQQKLQAQKQRMTMTCAAFACCHVQDILPAKPSDTFLSPGLRTRRSRTTDVTQHGGKLH